VNLIVDTYNILHCWKSGPTEPGRDVEALARLIRRSRFASGRVRLVCDGVIPDLARPALLRVQDAGLGEVLYAGPGQDADSLIEKLLQQESAPRRTVVASSDRRIMSAASRRGATPMRADAFLIQVIRDASAGPPDAAGPAGGRESLNPAETAQWLRAMHVPDELQRISGAVDEPPGPAPKPAGERGPSVGPSPIAQRGRDPDVDDLVKGWDGRVEADELDMARWLGADRGPPPGTKSDELR